MKKKTISELYKNLTFAEASKKIRDKYKNADTDLIEKESMEFELSELIKLQEEAKLMKQAKETIKQLKCGGMIKKYDDGGLIKDVNGNPIVINNMQPGQISYPNTWATPQVQDIPQSLDNTNLILKPFAPVGPPAPFSGQVNTLSTNIGDNIYEVPGSNQFSTPQDTPVDKTATRTSGSAYAPAVAGQVLSTALNAAMLAGGYDRVDPVNNPYENEAKRLMQERGIDTTQQRNQILSAYNAARQNLGNVRSANVKNALDANLMNITQDNLAESKLQEQQINQGYRADLSNVLNNLGQQRVQSTVLSDELTARNKGQFQSNLSALGANIADNTKFFTEKKLNAVQNKLYMDILNNKYSNFGLNPDVAKRLSDGNLTPDDIIVMNNALGKDNAQVLIKAFETK